MLGSGKDVAADRKNRGVIFFANKSLRSASLKEIDRVGDDKAKKVNIFPPWSIVLVLSPRYFSWLCAGEQEKDSTHQDSYHFCLKELEAERGRIGAGNFTALLFHFSEAFSSFLFCYSIVHNLVHRPNSTLLFFTTRYTFTSTFRDSLSISSPFHSMKKTRNAGTKTYRHKQHTCSSLFRVRTFPHGYRKSHFFERAI